MTLSGDIFCKSSTLKLLNNECHSCSQESMKYVITIQIPLFSLISDHPSLIVIGASFGVGVLIAVVVGVLIWWVLMRRKPRQEYTKGDYG